MDLPPPPPPFFHRPHHRDTRYANFIHPRDLLSSSSPHHLPPPPPPPPPPPHIIFPPPPPPHVSYYSVPHRFAFSPPHHSIPERAYPHKFDPPPKPYFEGNPFPFPPPRENLPLNHEYLARSPIFTDEVYCRESTDNLFDSSPLSMNGRARGRCSKVPDVGASERFSSTFCHGLDLYNKWDDEERRWDNRINYQGSKFNDERGYAANRCDTGFNNQGHTWKNKWVDDERGWDCGVNAQGYELHHFRNDDRRIQDYNINDRGCEFYSERDDYQRRQGYGITDRSFELYSERDVLGFDRFSGRLGRRASNEDFARDSKKRRVQKTRAVDRIELLKASKNRRRGNHFQYASKETNNKSFKGGKEKEGFKRLETRKEDKKEREQSPLELSISFESNGLVARAILTPSSASPAGKSNMDSTLNSDSGKVNINGCSPSSKSSVDMVKTDVLNHVLDTQSDANESSESNASDSRRLTTNANDIDENAMENGNLEGSKAEGDNVGPGPTHICRLKKNKKAKKRPAYKIPEELEPSPVSVKCIGTTNVPSDLGVSAAENKTLGDIKSQGTNHVGYWRARRLRKMTRAKKKRLHGNDFETTNDSGNIMNENIIDPSGAPEHDTNVFLSKTDKVPDAVLLPSTVAAVSKKVDHDSHFSNSESKRSNPTTLPASPQLADGVIAKYPCHTETLVTITKNADFERQSGNDDVSRCANETILYGGNVGGGLVLSKQSDDVNICVRNSDLELNSDYISFCTKRDGDFMYPPFNGSANCSLLEKAENVTNCDVGSADAYSEEFAVADCSNVNLATLENSRFLSVEHKGISAEFNNSVLCTMIEQRREDEADLSHTNGVVEGFLEATETSTDHSPKILRKRKASYDQNDLSPKINEHLSTVSLFNGEVENVLLKDCSSPERIDFPCARNSCEENDSSSEGPSGTADLNLDVSSGVDGSSCKKKKIDGSGLNSASIDGLYSDQSEVYWVDPVLPDWEAAQWKDAHTDAATAIDRCDATDMDVKVGEQNFSIADVDNISSHEEKEKLHVNDDLAFVKNLSPDNNVDCNANSGDEMIESDSDELSCPSSPEDLLLFSDFSSPINTKASPSQSRNGMIYGTGRTFNRRPVSAERLEKATSYSAHTNKAIASPVAFPMMQKSNFIHGKLTLSKNQPTSSTASKAFPAYPQKFNTSSTLPSTQATKSKTWHRTGSVAVTTPKVQASLPPQVHATKMSTPTPNSYVRKGNSLMRTPSPSSVPSPGFHDSSPSVYRASPPSIDGLKKGQVSKSIVDGPSLQRKPSPSSAISPGFHALSSSVYRLSPSTDGFKKGQMLKNRVDGIDPPPSLQRKPSPSSVISPGFNALRSSVYRLSPSIDGLKKGQTSKPCPLVNTSVKAESLSIGHSGKSPSSTTCNLGESLPVANSTISGCSGNLDIFHETMNSCPVPECQNGSDIQSTLDDGKNGKKITYVKRRSNQLVAASDSEDTSTSAIDKTTLSLSDGYYKSKKNQLVRTSLENRSTRRDAMVDGNSRFGSQVFPPESSRKRQLGKVKGFPKTFRSSKFSLVWKLQEDAQSSEKHNISERPQKVFSRLFPWKRATYRRSFMLALGSKPNNKTFSTISQKLLLSRKRGAVYTRSSHGYSLKMSKVFSVGGSSLKWSKSLDKNSKKANEDATRAVDAAEKKKKEEKIGGAIVSKTRNRVSLKLVPNVKLRPGERLFRIGSERYKMDSTRKTLHRITEEKASTSAPLPSEKDVKISYVPRRLYIGSNEYVRIGNGNQLVRDPKKRTRVLASEKVRWSLRTARLRWAKKKKYCQFFTKFGKCNKEDGKCPYIHDRSKIVVCTKYLNGSCSNPGCKLTHEVIPERMQDCSYFLKGSCSNENCPYRHVNVDPDSPVCESFLRGYCADGNECRKKHTYVCPAFEVTGICPQAPTCKLHHPKKKTESKPATEEKIVRGRYFDGGLINLTDKSLEASERVSEKGKDENQEGKFPDFISLVVSDDEMEHDMVTRQAREDNCRMIQL